MFFEKDPAGGFFISRRLRHPFCNGAGILAFRVMQMETVIYGDILLAVNWIVDYFLLVGVAAISGCGAARGRLLLGGALGGLSAFVFLAPPLPVWGQVLYQLASGTIVLLVAFRVRRPQYFLRLWFWYFLLNLCYTGLVLAAVYWLSFSAVRQNNLTFYYDVSPLLLVGCIVALYALLRLILLLFDTPQAEKIVRAEIEADGMRLYAEVLIDSGLCAEDILLGQPLLLLSWPDTLGRSTRVPVPAAPAARSLQEKVAHWFDGAADALPEPGLRLVPLHTAAGSLLVPAVTAQARINNRPVTVTLAFCREKLRSGRVQGLFGAKSYEMIGGK